MLIVRILIAAALLLLIGCEQIVPPPPEPPPAREQPKPPVDEPEPEEPAEPDDPVEPEDPEEPEPPPEPEEEPDPPAPRPHPSLFNLPISTIFTAIITEADPTLASGIGYLRIDDDKMWDSRSGKFAIFEFYVFSADFRDGFELEVWVNTEIGRSEARERARWLSSVVGRLPEVLRSQFTRIYVQEGPGAISAGQSWRDGPIWHVNWYTDVFDLSAHEEVMIHEASHLAIQPLNRTEEWLAAQRADGTFVSSYAERYPLVEDVAETMAAYLSVRYRRDRIGEVNAAALEAALAHRFAVLDAQDWDGLWCPIVAADC